MAIVISLGSCVDTTKHYHGFLSNAFALVWHLQHMWKASARPRVGCHSIRPDGNELHSTGTDHPPETAPSSGKDLRPKTSEKP